MGQKQGVQQYSKQGIQKNTKQSKKTGLEIRSFAQKRSFKRVSVSDLLSSLFEKERPWANCSYYSLQKSDRPWGNRSCRSLKKTTRVICLWFALSLSKNKQFIQIFFEVLQCFWQFFTDFPSAQEWIAPVTRCSVALF